MMASVVLTRDYLVNAIQTFHFYFCMCHLLQPERWPCYWNVGSFVNLVSMVLFVEAFVRIPFMPLHGL